MREKQPVGEYLLNGLFGSESNVKRIFKAFKDDNSLGIIYPQVHHTLPYMAFTVSQQTARQ